MFGSLPRSFLASNLRYYRARPSTTRLTTGRQFHPSTPTTYARKDSQDKDSINTESTEYSKSGSDAGSAQQDEAAFDPKQTDPVEQKDTAGEGTGSENPLEVSPANPEVSKPRGEQEGGAQSSSSSSGTTSDRQRSSGGGSPTKGQKNK
ncbi:MAG: hypothetical protein M1827_007662 [Pycnora praestabilis]|nr:MAG: hypothetical protein M1827_007662 [Pycnora praestabilis]